MECPCENCILVARCKYKFYITLMNDCTLIQNYLPDYGDWKKRSGEKLIKIYNSLHPTRWKIMSKSDNSNEKLWIESLYN